MGSFVVSLCSACGSRITFQSSARYARCDNCVDANRPHSLSLARHVRMRGRSRPHELDDYDPAGSAIAA
jgi:hypothetical protein